MWQNREATSLRGRELKYDVQHYFTGGRKTSTSLRGRELKYHVDDDLKRSIEVDLLARS